MADRATIKSYFETGKKPTQAEFAEWIDHTFDAPQLAIDTAEDAVAAAAEISANSIKVSGFLRIGQAAAFLYPSFPTPTVYRENGCAIAFAWADISVGVVQATITVTFDVANADEFYPLRVYSLGAGTAPGTLLTAPILVPLDSKTAGGFSFSQQIVRNGAVNQFRYIQFEAMG